ncbi:hypothetical protein LXL04_009403 [Taraxacum kok-saghyz]
MDRTLVLGRIDQKGFFVSKARDNLLGRSQRIALCLATRGGKIETCKYLLEELKLQVQRQDEDGETLLIHVVRQEYNSTECGAVLALSSKLVATALHHVDGNIALMEDWLSISAEVDQQDDAATPIVWADGQGQLAVAAGSLPYLEVLIQAGSNINFIVGGATTPLHAAANIWHIDKISGMEWLGSLGKVTHKWDRTWRDFMHNCIVGHLQGLITHQQLQAKVQQRLVIPQGAFKFTLKQFKQLTKEGQEGDDTLKPKQFKVHFGLKFFPLYLEIGVAYEVMPMVIWATLLIKYHLDQIHQWLIPWKGGTVADNTKEDVLTINNQDSEASLEDKTFSMAGLNVKVWLIAFNGVAYGFIIKFAVGNGL